jgi:hypothetical protein
MPMKMLYSRRDERDEVGQTNGAPSPNTKMTLGRPVQMIVATSQELSTRRKLVVLFAPRACCSTFEEETPHAGTLSPMRRSRCP